MGVPPLNPRERQAIVRTVLEGDGLKTVIQALLISLMAHIVYFAATISIGYWKTKLYKPDVANAWERVDMLQNEAVFGQAGSPVVYLFSFVGITAVSALAIHLYKTFWS